MENLVPQTKQYNYNPFFNNILIQRSHSHVYKDNKYFFNIYKLKLIFLSFKNKIVKRQNDIYPVFQHQRPLAYIVLKLQMMRNHFVVMKDSNFSYMQNQTFLDLSLQATRLTCNPHNTYALKLLDHLRCGLYSPSCFPRGLKRFCPQSFYFWIKEFYYSDKPKRTSLTSFSEYTLLQV